MNEDTDGISLSRTFLLTWPVFGETWKPWLEWASILLNQGRLRAFTQDILNGMQETASESWGFAVEVSIM